MMAATALIPGQALIYIADHTNRTGKGPEPEQVTVKSVGRKWAYLTWRGYRCDKNTLVVDGAGYSSPGRCYLSLDDYRAELAASTAWTKLAAKVQHWNKPQGITVATIKQAAALLGIELSENEP